MTEAAERLIDEAMRLSPRNASSWRSGCRRLGETTEELEAAWITEARQRLVELDAGQSRLSPWSEARARIFASR